MAFADQWPFYDDDEPPPDPEIDSAEELEELGYYDEDES